MSEVKNHNGVPSLFVNGKVLPFCAYMTYFEEYNRYADFAKAGYRLFSVPVLFAGRWISVTEGLKPFHPGIFDKKNSPDFSSFEHSVSLILKECPDALIMPRINISMPLWWIEENPDCVDLTGNRELLSSTKWQKQAGEYLEIFLRYMQNSEYSDHIAALHLAAGNTEEWFYFDANGGCCENAMPEFKLYLEKNHPECKYNGLPDLSPLFEKKNLHNSDYLRYFIEFSNSAVANAIDYFASIAKSVTNHRLAVGVFYGYSLEVPLSLKGTHALKTVIESENIDFICSPNSYYGIRAPEVEWTEMFAADSVRLHNKMCIQECDIRTHLTKPICECAPEYDTLKKMTGPIWSGLDTKEQSLKMLKKCFDRQLKKGNGFCWFDMWGGWYDDADIMALIKQMRDEYVSALDKPVRKQKADTAVLVDEGAFAYFGECPLRYAPGAVRKELGQAYKNYDMYDVFDFENIKDSYKKFVFISGNVTKASKDAISYCKNSNIPFVCNSFEKTRFELNELI